MGKPLNPKYFKKTKADKSENNYYLNTKILNILRLLTVQYTRVIFLIENLCFKLRT